MFNFTDIIKLELRGIMTIPSSVKNIKGTVLVTGSESMIGYQLCKLLSTDYLVVHVPHYAYDLLDKKRVDLLFDIHRPDYVFHLATYSGNIQFNREYPFDTYWRTTQMALNVFDACRKYSTKKIVSVLSSCAVADCGDKVLEESDLWKGLPNRSIECHGLAKRNLHALSRQIFMQFGIQAICCIVNNSFGPRDSFQPEKTKVVGAFIKKFVDAKENGDSFVTHWGTGIAKRELIYSKDVAKLLLLAFENYNNSIDPINIGNTTEISILELSNLIKKHVGYEGQVRWLSEKGDGQLRKKLDLTRMQTELLNNRPFEYTDMDTALQETIAWYKENKDTWTK